MVRVQPEATVASPLLMPRPPAARRPRTPRPSPAPSSPPRCRIAPRRGRARITSTRCANPSTSSISDEIRSTAIPRAARSTISSWICRFAPTSTPRVGSSAISTRGGRTSHFANSTFCWLPPESVETGASNEEVRMSSSCDERRRAAALAAPADDAARRELPQVRQGHVLAHRADHHEPLLLAALGQHRDAEPRRPAAARGSGPARRRAGSRRRRADRRRRAPARPRCGRCRPARPGLRSRPRASVSETSSSDPGPAEPARLEHDRRVGGGRTLRRVLERDAAADHRARRGSAASRRPRPTSGRRARPASPSPSRRPRAPRRG